MITIATPADLLHEPCDACGGSGNPIKVIGKGPDGRPDWVPKYPKPAEHLDHRFMRRCLWCMGKGFYTPARRIQFRTAAAQQLLVEVEVEA